MKFINMPEEIVFDKELSLVAKLTFLTILTVYPDCDSSVLKISELLGRKVSSIREAINLLNLNDYLRGNRINKKYIK